MNTLTHGRDEDGFSLIELMVVIMIIGTLATIALPAFLGQRTRGYEAAVRSDLRNAASAQEAYLTDNDSYTTSTAALLATGWKQTNKVSLRIISTRGTTGADSYCMAASDSNGGSTWYYDSANGQTTKSACT